MSNYLVDHARINAWCNPSQDNQLIFAGKRISKRSGNFNSISYFNRDIGLPMLGKKYHVFHIGQIAPTLLGLNSNDPIWGYEKWIKFSDTMIDKQIIINLYNDSGVNLPKFNSYYMYTIEKGLLYAVEHNIYNNYIDYNNDLIYLRLYTNAFYQSERSNNANDVIYYQGNKVLNNDDILTLQNSYNVYASKQGHIFIYKNGLIIDKIDLINVAVGDDVEFIFDGSVKRVQEYIVQDLKTFNSILDTKYKYILNSNDSETDTIDYQDDIEIHILHYTNSTRYKGIYYHRNIVNSCRMITHKDYSILVDKFTNMASSLNEFISEDLLDTQQMRIQIVVRESGYHRPLIYDNNRIFELYKLPNNLRLEAMSGINATCDYWKAENLENSEYCRLMRCNINEIDLELVKGAYGYNSISRYIGDTPSMLINSEIALPIALQNNSTIYEYDLFGSLLESNFNVNNDVYTANNTSTKLIEARRGTGTYNPNVKFGTDNITLEPNTDYKVYMCRIVNGIEDNNWEDITGSVYYTVTNNILTWNNYFSNQFLMVRFANTYLDYTIDMYPSFGLLKFILSELEDRGQGILNYSLPIPLGELDIILNGKTLIQDLDYVVNFPEVCITNKNYLNQPANSSVQNIRVRYTGFYNSLVLSKETNFLYSVEHQKLQPNDLTANNYFGIYMSSTKDGSRISVSTNNAYTYIFIKNQNGWALEQKIPYSLGKLDDNGDRIIVTKSNEVFIFVRSGSIWSQEQKLEIAELRTNYYFGLRLGISGDGTVATVTTADEFPVYGQVYVFSRVGNVWTEKIKLEPSDIEENDNFGYSVAISYTGNRIVIGAHKKDVGDTDNGAVYVFIKSGNSWIEEQKLIPSDSANGKKLGYFGFSVAITDDETRIIVGASNTDIDSLINVGSAYIFFRSDSIWNEEQHIIIDDGASNDAIGSSVSINNEGNTVVISSHKHDVDNILDAGAAYIYVRNDSSWLKQEKIKASDTEISAQFGNKMMVTKTNNLIIASASYKDKVIDETTTLNNVGAIYIRNILSTTTYKIDTQDNDFKIAEKPDDYGFIEHGMLSNNNMFDIRDDKVLHIVIDGKLTHRDNLQFSELLEGSDSVHPLNGKPYQIKDVIVPMKDIVEDDTYRLRALSSVIDKTVSDYLTIKLPQPTRTNLNAIPEKYKVISPFICYIIYALINNNINILSLSYSMSDNEVIDICKPFEYLLIYDHLSDEQVLNPNYVTIIPHNLDSTLSLTPLKYNFLTKVIRLYGNNIITTNQLSPYITVTV